MGLGIGRRRGEKGLALLLSLTQQMWDNVNFMPSIPIPLCLPHCMPFAPITLPHRRNGGMFESTSIQLTGKAFGS